MSVFATFEDASAYIKKDKPIPDGAITDEMRLKIYGLFKQATEGDVQGDRPGMTKLKDRAKYDSWASFKGMSKEEAKSQYIKYVTDNVVPLEK